MIACHIAEVVRDYIDSRRLEHDSSDSLTLDNLFIVELEQMTDEVWRPVVALRDTGASTPQRQATPPDRLKVPPHGAITDVTPRRESEDPRRTSESDSSITLEH